VAIARREARGEDLVWQLDPDLCTKCGRCETDCVLDISAVKAVNFFPLCAMCDVCTGYFRAEGYQMNSGAENQLCPTGAVRRKFIAAIGHEPFFEYTIDEDLCIGCGKCVIGCETMNGSLYLQVRHDRCLNCNECAIAINCPADAFRRVPRSNPTLRKKETQASLQVEEELIRIEATEQRDATG